MTLNPSSATFERQKASGPFTNSHALEVTLVGTAHQPSIASDFSKLLRGITQKTINERASEKLPAKTFVDAIKLFAALEKNPSMMQGWVDNVRKLTLIGELALKDPSSQPVKDLLLLTLQQSADLKAIADPALVTTALRICQHAADNDLFAPGASKEKITKFLQEPLEAALKQYVKEYGQNSPVNKALEKAGHKGQPPLTPLQTLLKNYR
jgi:hypothetical protein